MYKLFSFLKGDFPVVGTFDKNSGIFLQLPALTPIFAPADAKIQIYRNSIVLIHDGFGTIFTNIKPLNILEATVKKGQQIGYSSDVSNGEAIDLLFQVAPCDANGNKTLVNDHNGFIDPVGPDIEWDLGEPKMNEESLIENQASNYRIIYNFLTAQTEFNTFLQKEKYKLDSVNDKAGGHAVVLYFSSIADEFEKMNAKILLMSRNETLVKPSNLLVKFTHGIKTFIWQE